LITSSAVNFSLPHSNISCNNGTLYQFAAI
jgi:hypothetical protein